MLDSDQDQGSYDLPEDKFMRVYNNLPIKEREQTIVVIDDEPISWKMAEREITESTKMGEKIAKKLEELEII